MINIYFKLYLNVIRIFLLTIFLTIFYPSFGVSLDDIYADLKSRYPQYQGITYDAPSWNNTLEDNNWLLQTPKIWGTTLDFYNKGFEPKNGQIIDKELFVPTCTRQEDCDGISICKLVNYTSSPRKLCVTNAHDILENIYNAISNANESVDIGTLGSGGFNGNAFKSVIKNALHKLAFKTMQTRLSVVVRYLEGSFLPMDFIRVKLWLNELVRDLPTYHLLAISVANMRSCVLKLNCGNLNPVSDLLFAFSWNHAKLINVDNKILITGGENFWGTDYLETNPVNDSNIKIQGAVAQGATNYLNILWNYVNKNQGYFSNFCQTYYYRNQSSTCMTDIQMEIYLWPRKPSAPSVQEDRSYKFVNAMYISKLDNGVEVGDDADQSEIARIFAIKHAKKSIKISQQAFFNMSINPFPGSIYLSPAGTADGNLISAIAYAIHKNNAHAYIVQGNYDENGQIGYTSFVDLDFIYDAILAALKSNFNLSTKSAIKELYEYLHLANLSYSPLFSPLDQKILMNQRAHNKFWMVDDQVFYFGSHNFYPAAQQEFGVLVENNPNIQDELLEKFWNPMWKNAIKFKNPVPTGRYL